VDRRHNLIKTFLKLLGVPDEIADEDACEVEHSLHPETLEKLQRFMDAVRENPEKYPILVRDED
jgi:Mn-dependent DtxR family transcriptional regulator